MHLEAAALRREIPADFARLTDETMALRREVAPQASVESRAPHASTHLPLSPCYPPLQVREMARTRSELLHLVVRSDLLGNDMRGKTSEATEGKFSHSQPAPTHHAASAAWGTPKPSPSRTRIGTSSPSRSPSFARAPEEHLVLDELRELQLPGVGPRGDELLEGVGSSPLPLQRQASPFLATLREQAPLAFPTPPVSRAASQDSSHAQQSPAPMRAPMRPASARVGVKPPSPRLSRQSSGGAIPRA